VTMDLNGIEHIQFNALGGADIITVHDLRSTGVTEVVVNLAATGGGGDGATDQVIVQGTAGNDTIRAETNGTSASVTGLAAVTNVTGLEAIDQVIVDGGDGSDTLIGGAGRQILHGGEGDDVLAGGAGDDQMFGDAGNDRMVWNPGDGTDLMEGGDGSDTAEVNGGNGAEVFSATANGARVRFDRISPAPFSLDIGTTEKLVVNMGGGDDMFSATGNLAALTSVTVDGGAGNDTILGGNGNDLLFGGDGNDFIDGNQGADTAFLGAGDDTFQWDPGDGSDVVEGQDGFDTLFFNGANIAEQMDVLANGTRTLFTRNVGNITMDLAGVERINVNALGGADIITVHDMSGTGVTEVSVDLAAAGGAGDGAADQVIAQGSSGDDVIDAETNGTSGTVTGLAAVTNVTNLEAIDQLIVDGGAGNDMLIGGAGTQVLHGGEGDDVLAGGAGDDQMFGDAGNDRMVWKPGDGTDLMEGGDGVDTAEVNGGNGAEQFTVTANGTRVRFDRISPAPFSLDIGTAEKLVVNMGGGDDMFSAAGNLAALISVTVDGGAGDDTILGGNGNDLLFGGDGNDFIDGNQGADTAFLGAGDDTFQWDPGDGSDVVEGQDGFDTLLFNGANIAEQMDVLANGTRALFTRNVGNITMDLAGVERINVNALGGADLITVHDLSGTGVTEVDVNLASNAGTGDGAADQVIVQGTSGDDVIHVETNGSSATVTGLAAVTNVTNLEAIDQLVVDGGAGNDTIFGSAGNDFVVGGRGTDTAFLGAGDDTFVWNPGDGNDLVEGQDGFDTLAFNGANIAEKVDVLANGSRTQFTRDIATINMDLNGVERIDFNALGGTDNVTVHDLSGTGVTQVNVKLAGTLDGSAGDGAADQVTVEATSGDDVAVISGDANGVSVVGLPAQVNVTGMDGTLDHLQVNGGDGDDVLDARNVAAGAIGLVLDGGAGNDVILGSAGDDVLRGGEGDDIIIGGGGHDIIDAGPGDNVVIQGFTSGEDRIDLRGVADAHDFAWVLAHAHDVDGSAVIDFGDGAEMKVADVNVASLHASDFLLA